MKGTSFRPATLPCLLTLALVLSLAAGASLLSARGPQDGGEEGAGAPDKPPEPVKPAGPPRDILGTVQRIKGTEEFYTFTYRDGKKSVAAFLKLPEGANLLYDKFIQLTDLKQGDAVWVFGRPVEREAGGQGGYGGVDRQIQNVSVVCTGKELNINSGYKDPRQKDSKWCQAVVSKPGPALWVKFDGQEYKLVTQKATPIFAREESSTKGAIKNGTLVLVAAEETTERPESKKPADEKKPAYLARKVVLLDRRLERDAYPLVLKP
jgi:hypothetical protein